MTYKKEIIETLRATKRENIENVIEQLEKKNFFEVPASVTNHNNFEFGLAKHSWEVYQCALKLNDEYEYNLSSNNIAIATLLHDVCKADVYYVSPHDGKVKANKENRSKGHGSKSVKLIKEFAFNLTYEELMAIWWHMGEHEQDYDKYSKYFYPQMYEQAKNIPLCRVVMEADKEASVLATKEIGNPCCENNDSKSSPSWDSRSWLQRFHTASQKKDTHGVRKEVFMSTVDIVKAGSYITNAGKHINLKEFMEKEPLKMNTFYKIEQPEITTNERYKTIIRIENNDCLATAKAMFQQDSGKDVCVLNMASRQNPGGGVYSGAGAQEEYLFRCSDYFRFLFQYAKSFDPAEYEIAKNPDYEYPLDRNFGGIFSKSVTVFRDKESSGYALLDTPWKVDMMAVPAMNLMGGKPAEKDYKIGTLNKIRTILRGAYNGGSRRLVLGAFGCGAFRNDPEVISKLFKEVLHSDEFCGAFKEVVFAIIEDHNSRDLNYKTFQECFRN